MQTWKYFINHSNTYDSNGAAALGFDGELEAGELVPDEVDRLAEDSAEVDDGWDNEADAAASEDVDAAEAVKAAGMVLLDSSSSSSSPDTTEPLAVIGTGAGAGAKGAALTGGASSASSSPATT